MAKLISHIKSQVKFEVLKEEKDYFIVVKMDEPEIRLRLEKFAVDGNMFQVEKAKKDAKPKEKVVAKSKAKPKAKPKAAPKAKPKAKPKATVKAKPKARPRGRLREKSA